VIIYSSVSEKGKARLGVELVEVEVPIAVNVWEPKGVPSYKAFVVETRVDSTTDQPDVIIFDVKELKSELTPIGELRPCSVTKTVRTPARPPLMFSELLLNPGSTKKGLPVASTLTAVNVP